jgi:glycosyltransferase involved in cell wall biosynthesis
MAAKSAARPAVSIRDRRIAVLVPCLDEEATVAGVVGDFRAALPGAAIYVFDNGSRDRTAERAAAAGAIVVPSPRRGKGAVVRHMLRSVDADVYVLVDGDGTYPADAAPDLIAALEKRDAAMVVGNRRVESVPRAFRKLHGFGNSLLTGLIDLLFSARLSDVLSGYRVLSRDFVRSLPLRSAGFEIEAELTLQALLRRREIVEVPVPYGARPAASPSKLNTFRDGLRILKIILLIFMDYKPIVFFSSVSLVLFVAGLLAGWKPIADYIQYRYVYHVPLALLAAALEILAVVCLGNGLVLETMKHFQLETLESIDRIHGLMDPRKAPQQERGDRDLE